MLKVFEMIDLGLMHYFLGMEIQQAQNEMSLSRKKYMREILKRFNTKECKSPNTPMIQKEKLQKAIEEEPLDKNVYKRV